MSSVYKAVHVQSGHEVALKVLPLALAANPIVMQRFLREARSAEALEHPNIVAIFDRGVDRGRHYLVLEYVPGNDLHEYVQLRGPMSAYEAVRVVRQIVEGLRFAAARGLVHRDIKPSNILRSNTGEIKIADLGLALHTDLEDERVTREGTTVGTVDYMAPEQARDSRAASLQSDLYSLGCTLYYLLTGIPPFPGGDITDKLTRHAKSPPPDVRDLRPDLPVALSSFLMRLMAKRPEDRFADFDQLVAELDGIAIEPESLGVSVALLPIDTPSEADLARSRMTGGVLMPAGLSSRPPSSIPEISLANLPEHLVEVEPEPASVYLPKQAPASPTAVLPRLRGASPALGTDGGPIVPGSETRYRWSTRTWISLSVALGLAFVFCVIMIDRLVRSSPPDASGLNRLEEELATNPAEPSVVERDRSALPRPPALATPNAAPARPKDDPPRKVTTGPAHWVEPQDAEPALPRPSPYTEATLKQYLPAWALLPVPPRVEGPVIQVRRVPGARSPSVVPTLRMALDETKGMIEIADQGPLLVNDFRIPGEARSIRARDGFRPIIRVERPVLPVVRELPGVIVLNGKRLVLDSLDLIVNLRDLPAGQTSLFHCTGAELTVRNCTITLVNPGNQAFTLVRASGSASRGSRVRFEKTLVRGLLSGGFELGGGAVDLAVREVVLLGSAGPMVRCKEREAGADHRISIVGGILACRGPAIELVDDEGPTGRNHQPLVIRAFDTVFGRFQGAGIASVIASADRAASPREKVDWLGQRNLFCGWKGYFARGKETTLLVPSLAALRSTWNGTDQSSQEIPIPWPQAPHLGQTTTDVLGPFIPGHEQALSQVPVPRPYLGAQTLWTFPEPAVPVPLVLLAPGNSNPPPPPRAGTGFRQVLDVQGPEITSKAASVAHAQGGRTDELVFDADSAQWHGDLGAFLREKITESVKHARVRAVGSGPRRASPVRLPDGLVLELRVESPPNSESGWLSWSPEAESRGQALIELHGGTLVISQLRLRADESAAIESLIHVEDGDLVLHRCQIISPARAESFTSRLITFSAAGSRPRTPNLGSTLFATAPDRPVCILEDCSLITEGAAIRAQLGRGLVALTQTVIAAGTDAIELLPADVARSRFECDLLLHRCTVASQVNIVRVGPWLGERPGPHRPWLITTRNSAFLGAYDRRVSDTVLLRVDEEAMAGGTVFWQGTGDAAEVDVFTSASAEPTAGRLRDVVFQWVNFWGSNHMVDLTGPRTALNQPSVRLIDRLRPGRIEPSDLILDPDYHPGRPQLSVGADLARQGISRRGGASGRHR
jgi:serine/threonine-protein kinase